MNKYYIEIDGSEQGPFSIDELSNKRITKNSLVWTEGMVNWTKASKVDELKDLIIMVPPQLPSKNQELVNNESEFKAKKKLQAEKNIATAEELKINFKLTLYSLIIGFVASYCIFFEKNNGFSHLTMYYKWTNFYSNNFNWNDSNKEARKKELDKWDNIERHSRTLGWNSNNDISPTLFHEEKYSYASKKAIPPSILSAILISIVIIFVRYLIKAVRWIDNNSRKEKLINNDK